MRTLGNIIWNIPFLGFVTAALVFLIGLLFVVTIIAAPIGLGLIQYSKFLLLPFSYDMVSKSEIDGDRSLSVTSFSSHRIIQIIGANLSNLISTKSELQKKIDRRINDSACRFPNDCTLGKIASFREKKSFHHIS